MERNIILPIELCFNPMKKLAIINFEKDPDEIYNGLELQYFDDNIYGNGYRIIAYRLDKYVDVYDDDILKKVENEDFAVAGKGLGNYLRVKIDNVKFEKNNDCISLSFIFTDKIGRIITVNIIERSKKKSKGINLLAPIGSSSENPSSLPLFFLYGFDFIRKHKTISEVIIGNKKIKQDNFIVPFPKDLQWRYYSRYSSDCIMFEFGKASSSILKEYEINSDNKVIDGFFEYSFINNKSLKEIRLIDSNHPLSIEFLKSFPDLRSLINGRYDDTFKITLDYQMGYITGNYTINKNNNIIEIELIPSGGWMPVFNSFLTKLMFNKKSIFCNWVKTYKYKQTINLNTLESKSKWERLMK